MTGSDALRTALDAMPDHFAIGVRNSLGEYDPDDKECPTCGEDWPCATSALISAARAALDATKPADPVETFLDSIPDDGLPDRIGDHYRVVTVCGHCGEVWSKLALDATNEPETDADAAERYRQAVIHAHTPAGSDALLREAAQMALDLFDREVPYVGGERQQVFVECARKLRAVLTATNELDKREADALAGALDATGDELGRWVKKAEIYRLGLADAAARANRAEAQRDQAWRNLDTAHEDVAAMLRASGLGDYARPISAHDVIQTELLPWIASRAALDATNEPEPLDGATRIANERRRQIEVEHFTADHDDDAHDGPSLAVAAACYAMPPELREEVVGVDGLPADWPWDEADWRPGPTRVRELEKAGALIAAEIDRLIRVSAPVDREEPACTCAGPTSDGGHRAFCAITTYRASVDREGGER